MITKHKIQFDSAAPTANDRLGAFILGKDGAVVMSETIDAKECLNTVANLRSGAGVDLTETGGALDVNLKTSALEDIDIRDLSHTQDSVKIGDGEDFLAINDDGSINVNMTDDAVADDEADAGNPLKVGGRGVNQANVLSALSASNDRFDLLGDLYRRVHINEACQVGWKSEQKLISEAAVQLDSSKQTGRKKVMIQNLGDKDIYIGSTNAVTIVTGILLPKHASLEMPLGQCLDVYAIGQSGAANVDIRFGQAA